MAAFLNHNTTHVNQQIVFLDFASCLWCCVGASTELFYGDQSINQQMAQHAKCDNSNHVYNTSKALSSALSNRLALNLLIKNKTKNIQKKLLEMANEK